MQNQKEDKSEQEKQQRIANFAAQRQRLMAQGYKEHIETISIAKAGAMALVTAGPIGLVLIVLYILFHQGGSFEFSFIKVLLFFIVFLICIPLHEFLHGFTWHFFCKEKWKSIHFGIIKEYLTPYCHCQEPLRFGAYLLGALMPLFVLGIGLSVAGIVLSHIGGFLLGIFNVLAAGGDSTVVWMMRKYKNCLFLDHPAECGFAAFCNKKI